MKKFEYDITLHPAESFKEVAIFCSAEGECNVEAVPGHQLSKLGDILNQRGQEGWGLVQLSFGKDGVMAFWKRRLA
jgi:hypothetical protein